MAIQYLWAAARHEAAILCDEEGRDKPLMGSPGASPTDELFGLTRIIHQAAKATTQQHLLSPMNQPIAAVRGRDSGSDRLQQGAGNPEAGFQAAA